MLKLLIKLLQINQRQAIRYPLQAIMRLITALALFFAFAAATRTTSDTSLAESLLATLVVWMAMIALTKTANLQGSGAAAREESFLYPYPIWSFQLLRVAAVSAINVVALIVAYAIVAGSISDFAVGASLVFFAYLGASGLGLLLFAANLLFVKTDMLNAVVILGVLSLAFMPLDKAPYWTQFVPLANAVQAAQGMPVSAVALFIANFAAILFGIATIRFAEREVVRRGIAGLE